MVNWDTLSADPIFLLLTLFAFIIGLIWGFANIITAIWPESKIAQKNLPRPKDGWDVQMQKHLWVISIVDLLLPVPFTIIYTIGVILKQDFAIWAGLIAFSTWLFSSVTFVATLKVNGAYEGKRKVFYISLLDLVISFILILYLIGQI